MGFTITTCRRVGRAVSMSWMIPLLAGTLAGASSSSAQTPSLLRADLNCDGFITVADIGPFVTLLIDPTGYAAAYPDCDPSTGDINRDGFVTVADIGGFVQLLLPFAGDFFAI